MNNNPNNNKANWKQFAGETPIMGEMPHADANECEEMETPIFLSKAEAGAIFNAIGFCCTAIKASQCVIQEPIVTCLVDEELSIYGSLRNKLYAFLCEA